MLCARTLHNVVKIYDFTWCSQQGNYKKIERYNFSKQDCKVMQLSVEIVVATTQLKHIVWFLCVVQLYDLLQLSYLLSCQTTTHSPVTTLLKPGSTLLPVLVFKSIKPKQNLTDAKRPALRLSYRCGSHTQQHFSRDCSSFHPTYKLSGNFTNKHQGNYHTIWLTVP